MKINCLVFAFLLFTIPYTIAQNNLPKTPSVIKVITTAQNTSLRMSPEKDLLFEKGVVITEKEPFIFVDDSHTFQTMLGIGGAITDASAEVFAQLTPALQEQLLNAYYDSVHGIGYTLARTNIQSCDFSSSSYSYVENGDKELKTFSVRHDEAYRIPLLKKILSKTGNMILYASPWSPPAWMKTNNDVLHGGTLLPEYYQSWADFYIKFIQAYEKHGLPIWGITVQNEPMAVQKWESCVYTAEEERDFIKNYIGPTLLKNGMADKKLIAWDHNRDLVFQRSEVILNDPEAARYVWGIGYHWYETWTGGPMQFDNVRKVHETFPGKNLIFTEGCAESFNKDRIDHWSLGEVYGNSMIHDFNNGTVAWTDWNILLDENGGPNHAGNFCFAPVHSIYGKELHYTNSYYYIGHFSKFIRPGAVRINASATRNALSATAFKNKDGNIAVVVMNSGENPMDYYLCYRGKSAKVKSLPHSISTLVFNTFD
ncbi:MAG: glycoside hydrolase family 30 protein [Chitinophagaceae bacterium]|nr:glycoside hydrolase family 30 protein [Chitinophagaceae bacterium]